MEPRLQQANPVIVIGMHRSGTRLLAQILDRIGIFMGADQQADSESVTFMQINEGILHQCGAFWSEPMSAHFLLSQPDFVDSLAESVSATLSRRLGDYVGQSGLLQESGAGAAPKFGWKDPRNTFTLPVWRRLFPDARLIHILRHGVDVAASLARRHCAALLAAAGGSLPGALGVIRDDALGVLSSRRGWTLAEALTMWEQYVEKARGEIDAADTRALEIRFEDLLAEPQTAVANIAEFCGAQLSAEVSAWLESIESRRAFAFRSDPALLAFAQSAAQTLERFGYAP